jgi:hypothetical protein
MQEEVVLVMDDQRAAESQRNLPSLLSGVHETWIIGSVDGMNEPEDTPQTYIAKAQTLDEIADFWDMHSLDDYWDQTREAVFTVRAQYRQHRSVNMLDLRQLKPQYVINEAGEKTAIILPLEAFEELLEDIEDLAIVAERREEPTMTHGQLVTELKRDGLL